MTDDQGWGDLGIHGNDSISTPHLDALAQRSVRFDRFYVSPVCAPTRASLLTGRYHLRTGTSWVTHRKEVMREDELTIAEVFKSAGYATGLFGKWHNGEQYPNNPQGQGFDEFFGFAAGHWNNYFDTELIHNGEVVETEGFITDVLTDKAIDFIQKNSAKEGKRPFLCYVPYNAPHSPFQVPDSYYDKYRNMGLTAKNASVYGMVENIDDNIQRLLHALEKQQILENTIVVFLTDNGPNGRRYNGNMRGTKGSVHEGGVRVPCFISWKDHLPENKIVDQISAHIDLLPTLADLCQVDLPKNNPIDGRSLVPLMMDHSPGWKSRNLYTIHTEGENRIKPAAVRTDEYRMVIDYDGNAHLFDMKNDPYEEKDLVTELPERTKDLKNDLEQWYEEVTKDGITPPAIQVGHMQSPTTILPAPEAQLNGNLQFKGGRGWANDYIVNWKDAGSDAVWDIESVTTGTYEVFALYNCSSTFLTSKLSVSLGIEEKDFRIQNATEYKFKDSPDRVKRGEVYEKKWARQSIGVFELENGEHQISLELEEKENQGWMELKGLEIIFSK